MDSVQSGERDPTVWVAFYFGAVSGDIPVTGDWDGNGTETPGIFRGGQWFLTNQIGANPPLFANFYFGQAGDTPLTGDWDANGTTNWVSGAATGSS